LDRELHDHRQPTLRKPFKKFTFGAQTLSFLIVHSCQGPNFLSFQRPPCIHGGRRIPGGRRVHEVIATLSSFDFFFCCVENLKLLKQFLNLLGSRGSPFLKVKFLKRLPECTEDFARCAHGANALLNEISVKSLFLSFPNTVLRTIGIPICFNDPPVVLGT